MSSLTVKLGLNTAAFSSGLKSAGSMAAGFGRTLAAGGSAIAGLAAPLAGLVTAGAALAGIKGALDFGGEMSDMSARTGIAVKDLVILGQAFQNAGMDSAAVGPAVNKLQKALSGVNDEGEPTNKTFGQLGLNMAELQAMNPSEQLQAVGKAIANVGDPAQRAAASMGIFGKSGGEMLALFRDPDAIATATQQVGAQAEVLGRNADVMDKISDAFGAVKSTLRGFFIGLVEPLLPLLTRVGDWLNSIAGKAVEFGQKIGSYIAQAATILENGWNTGTLGNLVLLGLQIAFGTAANFLGGLLLGVVDGFGNALGAYFEALFSMETVMPLIDGLLAIPELLLGGLLSLAGRFGGAVKGALDFAVQSLVNMLPAKLRKWLTGSSEQGTKTLSTLMAEGQTTGLFGVEANAGDALVKDSMGRFANYGKRVGEIWTAAGKGFMSADFSSAQLFDTDGMKSEMSGLVTSLSKPIGTAVAKSGSQKPTGSFNTGGGGGKDGGDSVGIKSAMATDQFTKVGLFSGGSQGAFVDASRRTADNTAQLVKVFERPLRIENQMGAVAA